MSSVINTNIAAIRTHNTYNRNNDYMNQALTRVATGMKINSAKDGASTFAISEKMRDRIRANAQANQNAQNDTALLKTAEGGIGNTIDIIKTLKERAINAANDSNMNLDRNAIQVEVNQLLTQIDENARSVKFNGRTLLNNTAATDDSTKNITTEGVYSGSSVDGDGDEANTTPVNAVSVIEGAFTGSGSTTGLASKLESLKAGSTNLLPGDDTTYTITVNGSNITNSLTRGSTLEDLIDAINNADVGVKAQYVDTAGDALTDPDDNTVKESDGETDYANTVVGLYFVSKDGGSATVSITAADNDTNNFSATAVTTGIYDGTVPTTPTSFTYADSDQITDTAITDLLDAAAATANSPTDGEEVDLADVALYDKDGKAFETGAVKLTYYDGTGTASTTANITTPGWYNTTGAEITVSTEKASEQSGSTLNFYLGGDTGFNVTFSLGNMTTSGLGLNGTVDLSTAANAKESITTIENALQKALNEQTKVGAMESRLGYVSDNLVTMNENLEAADSTMRDSDIAKEMTNYMKYSVLAQASQYMLAQSSQNAFSVLNLLQA